MKKLNTFSYDLKIVQNPMYFRKAIEKCKTKEDFENFIKGLKQVKNEQ